MNHKTVNGWVLLSLLMSTLVYAYPQPQSAQSQIAGQYIPKTAQQQAEIQQYQYLRQQQPQPRVQHYLPAQYQQQQQHQQQLRQQQQSEELRKFAEKQNSLKKVSLDDIDQDIQTNQIDGNTFSWTNMLGSLMQMFFANQNLLATTKVEDSDGNGISAANPWTNVRIFTWFFSFFYWHFFLLSFLNSSLFFSQVIAAGKFIPLLFFSFSVLDCNECVQCVVYRFFYCFAYARLP